MIVESFVRGYKDMAPSEILNARMRAPFYGSCANLSADVAMTLAESIAKDVIRGMDKPERERMIALMLDEFLHSMTMEERKEMMARFIPEIVSRVMEGVSPEDRKTVLEAVIATVRHPELHGKEKRPDREVKDIG